MPRHVVIPTALSQGPFTLVDLRRAGLKRWHLEGKTYKRIAPAVYVPAHVRETIELKIHAASCRLPEHAVFSGLTAAWLHGLDVEPCEPIEITVAAPSSVSTRSGMRVRRRSLAPSDIVKARGYPVTSVVRTLADVTRRLSLTESVVLVDQALNRGRLALHELGAARPLARLVEYAEPRSESPMETRLRMIIVLAGLPRPEAQVTIRDRFRRTLGRPDLYYREQKLGIEYDGSTHKDSLAEDNHRQNRLLDAGVRLLRFTSTDVYNEPDSIVRLIRSALVTPR
jgi:hypothetical protein